MPFTEPIFNPRMIIILSDRIDLVELSLSLSNHLRERYLIQLARIRTHRLTAPVAGDSLDAAYERIALRDLAELENLIAEKTRLIRELEMRLELLVEANRWVWLL
jgi:hypothetical protein